MANRSLRNFILLVIALKTFGLFCTTVNAQPIASDSAKQRTVLGWEERTLLLPENVLLETKFTPGTDGNILHVEDLKTFKKGNTSWAKFTISSRKGGKQTFEKEVIGRVSFRKASGKSVRRPVVKLGVCLANHYSELDISLGDRSSYSHELVLGRDSIAGNFVIDPALSHVSPPSCSPLEKSKKTSKSVVR